MLKALRHKKTAKKIWIALAVIIIISFVFWGFGRTQRSGDGKDYAGKIYGRAVTAREFQETLQATKNQAIMQFGDKFTEVQKYIDFNAQAWERLAALTETKRRGIRVSDKEIEDFIAKLPYFHKEGRFDDRTYQEMLQYVFHTPARTFEEEIRQNLALGKLFTEVTDSIKLGDEDIKQEYRKTNEEISVNFIAALPADFAKGTSPKESELKDYFDKNSFKFKQPLSFNIEYITLDSEKKTLEAAKLLNSKADIAKVAKGLGLKVMTTGLFAQNEPIAGIGWSPEVLNIISNLKVAEYAHPIHLDNAYYILRLKERKEAYIPEFNKIKGKVNDYYVKEESERIAKVKIAEGLKKLRESYAQNPKAVDFAKTAKALQLKSGITQPFKFGSYIEGIGASDALWMAAESLKVNEISDIVSIPMGLYIVRLKARTPIDEKKFQAEKEDFSKKLLLQKKQDYFAKFTEALKKKAQPQ
jgi:peptidyl-prolyl cis-trans isomerase D